MGWMKSWACAAVLCAALSGNALVIDGREVEDLYAYIIKILEEDERALEDYRLELSKNPDHRGYRPYAYNALRHLSTEDVIYGALQGGLTAVRELGPDAQPQVLAAKAEANIHRVMELFPMLARDFNTGQQLLKRMEGTGRLDYFQLYLLRRSQPGRANPSLFSAFWQDEVQRNRDQYRLSLESILESPFGEPHALTLAIPLYTDFMQAEAERQFSEDPGIRAAHQEGRALSLPDLLADEALRMEFADADALKRIVRALSDAREALMAQDQLGLQRPDEIKKLAQEKLAQLDSAFPGVANFEAATEEITAPPLPVLPDTEATEASPPTPANPNLPRIGIPSLEGL